MTQVILQHTGARGDTQSDGVGQLGGHTGADGTTGTHEAIHMGSQLGKQQVQALQSGSAAHKVAVVKGEHHSIPAFGVENVGQMALHSPLQTVGAFQIESTLSGGSPLTIRAAPMPLSPTRFRSSTPLLPLAPMPSVSPLLMPPVWLMPSRLPVMLV